MAKDNALQALKRKQQEESSTKELHEQLAILFDLKPINRIEVYDNSHIFGNHAVGAMVVANLQGLDKNCYRRFNVEKGVLGTGGDDYAMMQEVMERRFKRMKLESEENSGKTPDLMLIDGGAEHLKVVQKTMKQAGIHIQLMAIAKGKDRNAGRETFHLPNKKPTHIPFDHPVMYYLQRLRDEAHRFAIVTHRAKRSKALTKSILDNAPGIGATRKKALLNIFGSAAAVKKASLKELSAVKGMTTSSATRLLEFLKHNG